MNKYHFLLFISEYHVRDRLLTFPWHHLVLIISAQHQAVATLKKTHKQLLFGDKIRKTLHEWKNNSVLAKKENSTLTNCLAECAHLTITVSQIERDIGRKSSFFHTPLHSTTPLAGAFPSEYYNPVWCGKLEWRGYLTVKKFRRYLYSFWRNSRMWQTDGRTPHADIYRTYTYASCGKNSTEI